MIFAKLHCNTVAAFRDDKIFVKISSHKLLPQEPAQDDLAGTWVFNDRLDFTAHNNTALNNIPLAFVSNGTEYTMMTIGTGTASLSRVMWYQTSSSPLGGIIAYSKTSFTNTAYQTIDISTTFDELSANYAKADLVLAFLRGNATKLS